MFLWRLGGTEPLVAPGHFGYPVPLGGGGGEGAWVSAPLCSLGTFSWQLLETESEVALGRVWGGEANKDSG